MVWGMISGDGVSLLVRLQGKINAGVYKQLVKDHVLPELRNSTKQPSIFMQDNAPCHKAMVVMNFLEAEDVTVMDWPPQSPVFNPIENVWKTIGERPKARNPKTTKQLWNALQEEWNKITRQDNNKLISSCCRICQSVIEAKVLHTKYLIISVFSVIFEYFIHFFNRSDPFGCPGFCSKSLNHSILFLLSSQITPKFYRITINIVFIVCENYRI